VGRGVFFITAGKSQKILIKGKSVRGEERYLYNGSSQKKKTDVNWSGLPKGWGGRGCFHREGKSEEESSLEKKKKAQRTVDGIGALAFWRGVVGETSEIYWGKKR